MTETDKQRRTAATSVPEEDKEKKGQTGNSEAGRRLGKVILF